MTILYVKKVLIVKFVTIWYTGFSVSTDVEQLTEFCRLYIRDETPPQSARYTCIEDAMISLMSTVMEQKILTESTFPRADNNFLSTI